MAPRPRKKKSELQLRRRAREHVLEAESYEEAEARLRQAFGKDAPAGASPPLQASPELDDAPPLTVGASLPKDATPEASPAASTAASAGEVKPPQPEPEGKTDAGGEAKADAGGGAGKQAPPPPNPFEGLDHKQIAQLGVKTLDTLAVRELGPAMKLTPEESELLSGLAAPVVKQQLAAGSGLKPADALFWTALVIYGSKYLSAQPQQEPQHQQQPPANLRVVETTAKVSH